MPHQAAQTQTSQPAFDHPLSAQTRIGLEPPIPNRISELEAPAKRPHLFCRKRQVDSCFSLEPRPAPHTALEAASGVAGRAVRTRGLAAMSGGSGLSECTLIVSSCSGVETLRLLSIDTAGCRGEKNPKLSQRIERAAYCKILKPARKGKEHAAVKKARDLIVSIPV